VAFSVAHNNKTVTLQLVRITKSLACLILSILPITSVFAQLESEAQHLFENSSKSVFQIRVIDNASNNKSSTGTGFLVDESNGLVATNYHVIASAINTPNKYRIELLDQDENIIAATPVNIDVVQDLALVRVLLTDIPALRLAATAPTKGENAYSIGYPFDLGITVIPGTYNGQVEHSVKKLVNFSGSINSGMSGGPALNRAGEVIGINVASAGNQISFLVPVQHLHELVAKTEPNLMADFPSLMVKQLQANSNLTINELLEGDWSTVPLGGAGALGEVTGFLRCWGESKNPEDKIDKNPFWAQRSCQTDHNIYLGRRLTTGKIELQFYWLESDLLISPQFYKFYDRIFRIYRPGNSGREQDLSNWSCEEKFVAIEDENEGIAKTVFCVRAYKKLAGIYDILFLQGSVSDTRQAHMAHFTLSGTTKELALQFTRKFMGSSVW